MNYKKNIFNEIQKYNRYDYLFHNHLEKYNLIISEILSVIPLIPLIICNKMYDKNDTLNLLQNVLFRNMLKEKNKFLYTGINFQYIIVYNLSKISNNKLIITNFSTILDNYNIYTSANKKINTDTLLFLNHDYNDITIKQRMEKYKTLKSLQNIYSSHTKNDYLLFLKNIINTNDYNKSIPTPTKKYDFISCHYGHIYGINETAPIRTNLDISQYITTIGISLKYLEQNGTLVIFTTIVNPNIPSYQKLIGLLNYAFQKCEIISDDINQNIFIGVPEFYIKCTGYKANISETLINGLIQIGIDTIDNVYNICDIIDYFDNYIQKNPQQTLFYKAEDNIAQYKKSISHHKSTKYKSSKRNNNSLNISKFLSKTSNKSIKSVKNRNTLKLTDRKSKSILKQMYFIEDINIPELNTIMQDNANIQFKVMITCSKIETIFISFFEMVNNYIENTIEFDKKGKLSISELALEQKKYTNLTKLLTFLEHNKMPYNKHALIILQDTQDDLINSFYNLYNPANSYLIKYNDNTSKTLIRNALNNFKLCIHPNNSWTDIETACKRIDLSYKTQINLLDSLDLTPKTMPKVVKYATEDMTRGLSKFISNRYSTKLPHPTVSNGFIKLWECLSTFNLIPSSKTNKKFRVFHICEAPGQMILACKYFTEQKRKNITDYEWIANSLNPFNYENKMKYGKVVSDDYGLINSYPKKWLWGSDNTGDVTRVKNIKWYRKYIRENMHDLNLIVGDGGLGTGNDTLLLQKLDLAQVIMVIACSIKGGSCIIKHFTPYITNHPETLEATGFFISFLYLYYVAFEEVSLFKPYSSNPDSGEFYVVGKGFNGIDDEQLYRLYRILDNFKANNALIPRDMIPDTFVLQINGFIDMMADYNIQGIEKTNLLLTCFKNKENSKDSKNRYIKKN